MTSLERYYTRHLRSLFISKFNYSDSRSVRLVRGMRWVFITKSSFFSMVMLLVFLSTGRWPTHRRVKRYAKGSKSASSFMEFSVTFGRTFTRSGLRLLQKCKLFHFPALDSDTVASDFLFEMSLADRDVLMSNWQLIVATLLELEGILDGKLTYAQWCARSIFLRCYFKAPQGRSLYYLQTAIRALQVPLSNSVRFESSLSNSRIAYTQFGE